MSDPAADAPGAGRGTVLGVRPSPGGRVAGTAPRPHRGTAVALLVTGGISVQFGGALAVWLMPRVGAAGVVTLRLAVAALVLMAVCRPRLRGHTRADWATALAFGLAIGAMNHAFYQAAGRLPLGVAVTLEVLGPLTLSVFAARRLLSTVWAALAVAGVFLLGGKGLEGLDTVGVGCALTAAALWAVYIVLSARTGRRFPRADGLALAMAVAAVLSLPVGIVTAGERLMVPSTVGIAAGVAMLSTIVPYTLELFVLRRLHAATFAVLMSLEPAVAALAGFLVLRQSLSVAEGLGIALVIVASMGAVRTRVGRVPGAGA